MDSGGRFSFPFCDSRRRRGGRGKFGGGSQARRLSKFELVYFGDQGIKFKFAENFNKAFAVGLAHFGGGDVELHRHFGDNRGDALALDNLVTVIFQGFAYFGFQFVYMFEDILDFAVGCNQAVAVLSPRPGTLGMLSLLSPTIAL